MNVISIRIDLWGIDLMTFKRAPTVLNSVAILCSYCHTRRNLCLLFSSPSAMRQGTWGYQDPVRTIAKSSLAGHFWGCCDYSQTKFPCIYSPSSGTEGTSLEATCLRADNPRPSYWHLGLSVPPRVYEPLHSKFWLVWVNFSEEYIKC